jgi:hypothetical protein
MKGKKTGGRQKGTPNKYTKIRHEILSGIEALGIKRLCTGAALESKLGVLKVAVSLLPKEIDAKIGVDDDLAQLLLEARNRNKSG